MKSSTPPGRRTAHRGLLGAGRRIQRSLRLRSRGRQPAPPDERPLRGARSRLVTRRTRLAFATDRFTTASTPSSPASCASRSWTSLRERASGRRLRDGKNISPQWTADGRALYFLSDREGVTNIYRTEIGGATTQVTNLLTGVSGITALSPALSVAQGRLVFSAYEDDGYSIYALDSAEAVGRADRCRPARSTRPSCRHGARPKAPCTRLLSEPKNGLPPPEPAEFRTRNLQAKAVARFRRTAYGWRGRRSLRDLRRRGHLDGLQRHARQPHPHDRHAGHQPPRRVRWNAALLEQEASMELGRDLDQTPYALRGFEAGLRTSVDRRSTSNASSASCRPIGRPRESLLSVQPRAARRPHRRVPADRLQAGPYARDLYRPTTGQQLIGETRRPRLDHRSISAKRRRRSFTTRRSAASPARSAAAVTAWSSRRARARSCIPACSATSAPTDAGPAVHAGAPRPVLRALWPRLGGLPPSGALSRIPRSRPWLRLRALSNRSSAASPRTALPGVRPPDWQQESRSPTPNCAFPLWAAFGGDNFYGPLPIEMALFTDAGVAWDRGTRPRLWPRRPTSPSSASAPRCASTSSALPSPRSITSVRSIDRVEAGSGSSTCGRVSKKGRRRKDEGRRKIRFPSFFILLPSFFILSSNHFEMLQMVDVVSRDLVLQPTTRLACHIRGA